MCILEWFSVSKIINLPPVTKIGKCYSKIFLLFSCTVEEILSDQNQFFVDNFAIYRIKSLKLSHLKAIHILHSKWYSKNLNVGWYFKNKMFKMILWSTCNFTEKFSEAVSFYNKITVKKVWIYIFCEIWQIFRLSLRIKDRYSFYMRHSWAFYSVYYSKKKWFWNQSNFHRRIWAQSFLSFY